ncbi:MAG: tetratricopeptide repeat protein [Spirochaetes bacterium]|jgi:tetratricopeptide (TPR) repeat protein|nr:tetratricopeptide repeat protein [Spirochaetota bacterium]
MDFYLIRKTAIISLFLIFPLVVFGDEWHERADQYWNEAQKFKQAKNYEKALSMLKKAFSQEKKSRNPRTVELSAQLFQIGEIYDLAGDYSKSLHYYKLLVKAGRKYSSKETESRGLNCMGESYLALGRNDEALQTFNEALELEKGFNRKDRLLLIVNNIARCKRIKGDFDGAIEMYQRALDVAKNLGAKNNISAVLSNIGTMFFFKRDYRETLKYYGQALEIDKETLSDQNLSMDFSNLGGLYNTLGRFGESINYYEQALAIDKKRSDNAGMAARLNSLGAIYFNLGDVRKAEGYYKESLDLNNRLGNKRNTASILGNLGEIYESLGNYDEALDSYMKALSLDKDLESKETISSRLSDIGMIYESRGRYGEAYDFFKLSYARDASTGKKNKLAMDMNNIGRMLVLLGKPAEGLEYFNRSSPIFDEIGNAMMAVLNHEDAGIAYYGMKNYQSAISCFIRADDLVGKMSGVSERERSRILEDIYSWLLSAYARDGKNYDAFRIAELSSLKKLFVFQKKPQIDESVKELETGKPPVKIKTGSATIVFSNTSWDTPVRIIYDGHDFYSQEINKINSVKGIYNRFGRDIENFVKKEDLVVSFQMKQRSRNDQYTLEFNKIVNVYKSLLSKQYITKEDSALVEYYGRELYNLLFENAGKNISGKKELIIKADGILSTIPFEALITPEGKFLVEKYDIRYEYSHFAAEKFSSRSYPDKRRSMFFLMEQDGNGYPSKKTRIESSRQLDIFAEEAISGIRNGKAMQDYYGNWCDGFKQIDNSPSELNSIVSMFPDCDKLSGAAATEKNLQEKSARGEFEGFRIFHACVHGIIVPEIPEISFLALSKQSGQKGAEDGLVNIDEISRLKIKTDIALVSFSGISKVIFSRGEGVWNISCAFNLAGSRSAAVSLWAVGDQARIDFLKELYSAAKNKNWDFGSSICDVKRSFISGKAGFLGKKSDEILQQGKSKYSNPFYWANFVIYGY